MPGKQGSNGIHRREHENIMATTIIGQYKQWYTRKVSLICDKCGHKPPKFEYKEEEDYKQLQTDSDGIIVLLACPKCDKDWYNNANVDFKATQMGTEIYKYLSERHNE